MNALIRTVAAVLGMLALAQAAFAHAMLDHAAPAVGSTVHGTPAGIELWFTQELEPAFSTLKVTDSDGRQVDKMDKALDPRDRSRMKVSVPPLPPGTYRVIWRVLSVDTHVTEGDFTFELAP